MLRCIAKTLLFVALLAVSTANVAFAGATLSSWDAANRFQGCHYSQAAFDKSTRGVVFRKKAVAPGEATGVGFVETPILTPSKPFNQVVPSWNADVPSGAYVVVLAKVRVEGRWTRWYKMGLFNSDAKPEPRTSFKDGDETAANDTDTLQVRNDKRADAVQVRLELRSTDGKTYPVVRLLTVNTNDPDGWKEEQPPVKSVWGKELDVPYLCQLSVPGGNVLCSATSTTMLLNYWSKQLQRPELTTGITETAQNCRDKLWNGTGNWAFNTAYAGRFPGIRAYVDRFTSVSQIEQWVARGVPVVVSVNYKRLKRQDTGPGNGHLMVIRGFTREGDPIFNDPWARLEKGEPLRKIFPRADLEAAWLGPKGSYGTVYLIHPTEGNRWTPPLAVAP